MWDFTFNGEKASDKNIIVNSIIRPILPTLRPRKMTIPGKDGAWDFGNNTYDEQIVRVVCTMLRPFKIQDQIRDIARWLSQKGDIVFSDEPDKYYTGRIYSEITQVITGSQGQFVIPFMCDPHAYAPQDAYNEVLVWDDNFALDTGQIYPNESNFNWVYPQQYMGLYNQGTLDTGINFVITGSVQGVKITHHESSKVLDLNTTLANQTLLIDTENYTCELSDGTNLLGSLTHASDFFKLKPGVNTFTFEGTNPNTIVEYTWTHKFL
jgi:predicted phage tail component-like protein